MPSGLAQTFTVWCERHTGVRLAAHSPRAWRTLRVVWSLLLAGAAILLLFRVAGAAEWRRGLATGLELGAPLLVLLALPAVSNFVKMLGWRALLPARARPALHWAYAAFVAAQGVNELGFSVLGEPIKVLVLPPAERAAGVRAVVADNLAAFAALLVVAATLAQSGLWAIPLVVVACVVLFLARRSSWSGLLIAFTAHYLGKLWLVVELGLGLHVLGQPVLGVVGKLALAWMGASALGAPVPGQLGVVEAALVQTGVALGIALPSLLALALIRRLRSVLWVVLGLLLAACIAYRKPGELSHVSIAPA